jgi:serine/threonine-protein kinase RsbW
MNEFKIEIFGNFEECDNAREKLVELVKNSNFFNDIDLFKISIAIEEALINAMEHGNKSDPTKKIFLDYFKNDNSIIIKVKDSGNGFDVNSINDPTKIDELNQYKDRGRGTYLIFKTMDKVTYNETGNQIIMQIFKKDKE